MSPARVSRRSGGKYGLIAGAFIGLAVTLLLFRGLDYLVSAERVAAPDTLAALPVDFIRLRPAQPPVEPSRRHPPPPPEKEEPPPPPPAMAPVRVEAGLPAMAPLATRIELPLRVAAGPAIGQWLPAPVETPVETQARPVFRMPPRYPPRALLRRIEGSVTVEFLIGAEGEVREPKVVAAEPAGVFEKAALAAIRRWRFAPEAGQGEGAVRRARQVIRFRLDAPMSHPGAR